jgi:hypothetical protein
MSILNEKFGTVVTGLTQITGFHREVDETCALLGYHAGVVIIPHHRAETSYRAHLQGSRIKKTFEVGTNMDS